MAKYYLKHFFSFMIFLTAFFSLSNLAFALDLKCDPTDTWGCGWGCGSACVDGLTATPPDTCSNAYCPLSAAYVGSQEVRVSVPVSGTLAYLCKCLDLTGKCGKYGIAREHQCQLDFNYDADCMDVQPVKSYGWVDNGFLCIGCSEGAVGSIVSWEKPKPDGTSCTKYEKSGKCSDGKCIIKPPEIKLCPEITDKSECESRPTKDCCWGKTQTDSTEKCRVAGQCYVATCGNGIIQSEYGEQCEGSGTTCIGKLQYTCQNCQWANPQCIIGKCGATGTCPSSYIWDSAICDCKIQCAKGQVWCPVGKTCLNCPYAASTCTESDLQCRSNTDCPTSGRNGCYPPKYRKYVNAYGTCGSSCWCDYGSYTEECSKSCGASATSQADCAEGLSYDPTQCACVKCGNVICNVKSVDCPAQTEAGTNFTIKYTTYGTITPRAYETRSVTLGSAVESCKISDQLGCMNSEEKADIIAPKVPGTYTYSANCYGASTQDKKYCGLADESKTCSVKVVDTTGPIVYLNCPFCYEYSGEKPSLSWFASEEVSGYELKYIECSGDIDSCPWEDQTKYTTLLSDKDFPVTSIKFDYAKPGKLYVFSLRAKDKAGNLGDAKMAPMKIAGVVEKKTSLFSGGTLDISTPKNLNLTLPKNVFVLNAPIKMVNDGKDMDNKPKNLRLEVGSDSAFFNPGVFGIEETGSFGIDAAPYSLSDQLFSVLGSYSEQELKSTTNVNFTSQLQKAGCPYSKAETVCTRTENKCTCKRKQCAIFYSRLCWCAENVCSDVCVESVNINFCYAPVNVTSKTGGKITLNNLKIETSSAVVRVATGFVQDPYYFEQPYDPSIYGSYAAIEGHPVGSVLFLKFPNEKIKSAVVDIKGDIGGIIDVQSPTNYKAMSSEVLCGELSQSFTPSKPDLKSVALLMAKSDNTPAGTVTLSVKDSAGTVLTSKTISSDVIGYYSQGLQWYIFDIDDIKLNPGSTYKIAVSSTAVGCGTTSKWGVNWAYVYGSDGYFLSYVYKTYYYYSYPSPALDIGNDGIPDWQYGAIQANLPEPTDVYMTAESASPLANPYIIVNGNKITASYELKELKTTTNVNITDYLQKFIFSSSASKLCTEQRCIGGKVWNWDTHSYVCAQYKTFCTIPINVTSKTSGKIALSNFNIKTASTSVTWYGDGYTLAELDVSPNGGVITMPAGMGIVSVSIPQENILSATLDMTGKSPYPLAPALDIGNDGIPDWFYSEIITVTSGSYFPYNVQNHVMKGTNYIIPSDNVKYKVFEAGKNLTLNLNGEVGSAKIKIEPVEAIQTSTDPGHGYTSVPTAYGCSVGSYVGSATHNHKIIVNGIEYTTSTVTPNELPPCSKSRTNPNCYCGRTYGSSNVPSESDPSGEHMHTVTINGKTYTLSSAGTHVHSFVASSYWSVCDSCGGAGCSGGGCGATCGKSGCGDQGVSPILKGGSGYITVAGAHSHTLKALPNDPSVVINGRKFIGKIEGESVVIDAPNGMLENGANNLLFGQENLALVAPYKFTITGNYFSGLDRAKNMTIGGAPNNPSVKFKGSSLVSSGFSGYTSTPSCSEYSSSPGTYCGCPHSGNKCYYYTYCCEDKPPVARVGSGWTSMGIPSPYNAPLYLADGSHAGHVINPSLGISTNDLADLNTEITVNGQTVFRGWLVAGNKLQANRIPLDPSLFASQNYITVSATNGKVSLSLSYQVELAQTKNPSVTINSQEIKHSGSLSNLQESQVLQSKLAEGSNVLSFNTTMPYYNIADQKIDSVGGSGKFVYEIFAGINKTVDISKFLNNYLFSCEEDPCEIPLTFSSLGSKILVEDIEVKYTENAECSIRKVYNVTVAGQLFYSNKTAASNLDITAKVNNTYKAVSKTDNNGYFHIVVQNVPAPIVENNPKITIDGVGVVDVRYECIYDYKTEKCS